MPRRELAVRAKWDSEGRVWYVSESDLPGLAAEAETVEALHAKVLQRVPELVDLNRHLMDWQPNGEVPVHLMAERLETVHLPD